MRTLLPVLIILHGFLCQADGMDSPQPVKHPTRLEPIDSPVSPILNAYWKAIKSFLLDSPADYGRMIFRPALSQEYSVSVYQRGDDFIVSVSEADSSIYFFSQKSQAPPKITRWSKQIDSALAKIIRDTWQQMISNAQPANHSYRGADGCRLVFSVVMPDGTEKWAETWSPETKPLLLLEEIGTALGYFAADTKTKRRKSPEEIMAMCRELQQMENR